jgi:hypothetical protein
MKAISKKVESTAEENHRRADRAYSACRFWFYFPALFARLFS